ncbi:CocE/NonD family hydrolase C-terminal non-catalytic domain-containing protein [Cupriavidus necator]
MAACAGLAAALSRWTRKAVASLPCGRGQYAVPGDLQLDHRTQYPLRAARRREHRRLLRGLDRATGSADAQPMVPDRAERMHFALLPVAWTLSAGSRLRVSISGADRGHFPQVPHGRPPRLSIRLGGELASYLDLPVRA